MSATSHDIKCRESKFPTADYYTDSPPVHPAHTKTRTSRHKVKVVTTPTIEQAQKLSPPLSIVIGPPPIYNEIVVLDPPPGLEVYATTSSSSDPTSYSDTMSRPDARK